MGSAITRSLRELTLRMMFMRSASADVDANAQQLPQYCGMCWLRVTDRYAVPLTLRLQMQHPRNMSAAPEFQGHRVCTALRPARLATTVHIARTTLPGQCWPKSLIHDVPAMSCMLTANAVHGSVVSTLADRAGFARGHVGHMTTTARCCSPVPGSRQVLL
jgi:hypothetical protein